MVSKAVRRGVCVRGSKSLRAAMLGGVVWALIACGSAERAPFEHVANDSEPLTRACGTGSQCSSWVYPSVYGSKHLVYVPDHEGDRIVDYGRVGWKKSALKLPSEQPNGHPAWGPCNNCQITPASTVSKPPDNICSLASWDRTAQIQAALDAAGQATPRGRVELPRGQYVVSSQLWIPDGVVLVGAAKAPANGLPPTWIHSCIGDSAAPIIISAEDPVDPAFVRCPDSVCQGVLGAPIKVLAGFQDPAVGPRALGAPSGGNVLNVGPGHGLVVNDVVLVTRKSTQAWIDDAGADFAFDPGEVDQRFERVVTRIEPREEDPNTSRVFFDQALTNAFETKYFGDQTLVGAYWYTPHTIQKFTAPPTRAKNSGVYNLRIQSHPSECDGTSCIGSADGIRVNWAEDAWIQDVDIRDFWRFGVHVTGVGNGSVPSNRGRHVTIENSIVPGWIGPIAGELRYTYKLDGDLNLVARCTAVEGRHDFMLGMNTDGPNVFLEGTSTDANADSGTHGMWSTGGLLDGIVLESIHAGQGSGQGKVVANFSTGGHGWTGANMVTWNTTAEGYEYYNPPTAQSWLIGSQGPRTQDEDDPHFDYYDPSEHGSPVGPLTTDSTTASSLYRAAAQLDRAVTNLEQRTYFAGDPDDFVAQIVGGTPQSPVPVDDPTWANPAFRSWVSGAAPNMNWGASRGLDYTSSGTKTIPLTFRFDLGQNDTIVHAYLAFRVFRSTASSNDAITLAGADIEGNGYADNGQTILLSALSADMSGPSVPPNQSFLPSGNVRVVRVVDLGRSDILSKLNLKVSTPSRIYGELNVNFKERIRADWVSLSLVISRG